MSMTNHPKLSPLSSAMITRLQNCKGSDVRSTLESIQKNIADLQDHGVQCGFCYVPGPGTMYSMGNKAITGVIEQSQDVIMDSLKLQSLSNGSKAFDVDHHCKVQSIDDLSINELLTVIVEAFNDLGIKWTDSRPPFWPENIPFQYPGTDAPDGFQGCWIDALRDIARSMYSYFNSYEQPRPQSITEDNDPMQGDDPAPPTNDEYSDNEEDEEIDVVNEPDDTGDNPPLISLDTYMAHLQYPSNRSHDEADTMSTSSEEDPPSTVNYFGYEMARGESLQTSPLSSGSSAASPKPHPSPLLVCAPQLYPYPAPIATQYLLQPSILSKMYSPLLLTSASSTDTPAITKPTSPMIKSPLPYSPMTHPLNAPAISSSTNIHSSSLANSYKQASSYTSTATSRNNKETLASIKTPASSNTQQEGKSKRGRNQGIYIYTTPTQPLKFMSLNGTSSAPTSTTTNSKFSYNTGKLSLSRANDSKVATTETKTKLLHDSTVESRYKTKQATPIQAATTQTIKDAQIRGKHATTFTANAQQNKTPSTSLTSDVKTKRTQGNMKRKRELVFHWYHSPDPSLSTPAPPTKRINSAGTV